MPRKKKPVPPDFRAVVKYDGLGFQRLKKRYGVGTATIQRWLSEERLQTRNTPNYSLAEYNKKRSAPTSEQLWARLFEAEKQERERNYWAQAQSHREQPQQNQAHAQPEQGHSSMQQAHAPRAKRRSGPAYTNEALEKVGNEVLREAETAGLIEIWPRIRRYFNEIADSFPEHEQRRELIRPIGLEIKAKFVGPKHAIAIKGLFRWVNGKRIFCESGPTAEAILFLQVGKEIVDQAIRELSASSKKLEPDPTPIERVIDRSSA